MARKTRKLRNDRKAQSLTAFVIRGLFAAVLFFFVFLVFKLSSLLFFYFPALENIVFTSLSLLGSILFLVGIWFLIYPEKMDRRKKLSHSIIIHFSDAIYDLHDIYYLEDKLLDDKGLLIHDGHSVAMTEDGLDEVQLFFGTNNDKAALLHLRSTLKELNIPKKLFRFEVIKK